MSGGQFKEGGGGGRGRGGGGGGGGGGRDIQSCDTTKGLSS